MAKKVEPEVKGAPPMTPEKLRKFLQSRDVGARIEVDDRPLTGWTPGPATTQTPLQEIGRLATGEELEKFAETLRKRKPATLWLRCDSPSCGMAGEFRAGHKGSACARCNFRQLKAGGHLQEMTPRQVFDYQKAVAVKAVEDARRFEAVGLARRNEERSKAGLPTFTLEQYRAERRAEFQQRNEREEQIQRLIDKGREMRAAKEARGK